MRLATDIRSAIYISALNGSLSERLLGENTDDIVSTYTGEEPFALPDSWKWCCFSDVVTVATNLVEPNDYQDYMQIAPDYIEKGTGKLKKCNTVGQNGIISKNHLFNKGQIIYSKIRPALRKAVIAPFDGLCSADMYPLRTELNTYYLLSYLLSDFFTRKAIEKSSREKMPKINKKDLGMIPIPVPPIEEQKRIIENVNGIIPILDEYEDIEDQLVSLKKQFPEDMRDAILQAAIQGKLVEQRPEEGTGEELYQQIQEEKKRLIAEGKIKKEKPLPEITDDEIPFEIPENWKWCRWGEIVNIVSARRVHQSDWRTKGIPFYRAREIAKLADTGFVENDLFISEELYNIFSQSGVPHTGDLMVSAVGTLGKTYVVKENERFYYKDASVLCFENFGRNDPDFLRFVMRSNLMKAQIASNSGGTTVNTLTMVRMVEYFIPLPPLAEQKRIVAKLEELLPLCDGLKES